MHILTRVDHDISQVEGTHTLLRNMEEIRLTVRRCQEAIALSPI